MRLLASASAVALLQLASGGGGGGLGPEIHTDTGFDNGANYTVIGGTGATSLITGDYVTLSSTQRLAAIGTIGTAILAGTAINTLYRVQLVVTAWSSGSLEVMCRNGAYVNMNITGPGTYTVDITSGVSGTLGNAFNFRGAGGATMTCTLQSLKQVL